MPTLFPFSRPLYVMLKPCGPQCNLACDYCYYLEKGHLYEGGCTKISDELLEKFVKEYIASQTMHEVLFTWHGGEPLLLPLSFYEKALALQQKYGGSRPIDNCIQTNGTLLTEEWCRFLHDHHWLVGLSIDGPAIFHDAYRKNRHGSPTFDKVMRGIEMLNRYEVEWNAMAVVNDKNADHPLDFYHFFKQIGCHYIQFTPIVERLHSHSDGRHLASASESGGQLTSHSVSPEQWGQFLCTILHPAVRRHPGQLGGCASRCVLTGQDLRPCRCDGMQRRRVSLRPLRVSGVQVGQPTQRDPGRDALWSAPAAVWSGQRSDAAPSVPPVPLPVCLPRRMPQEPVLQDSRR